MNNGGVLALYIPIMASACFAWARRTTPGLQRAKLCLPIAVLNIALVSPMDVLPLLLHSPLTREPLRSCLIPVVAAAGAAGRGLLQTAPPGPGSYWHAILCIVQGASIWLLTISRTDLGSSSAVISTT
jgi:hypothetical protein